MKYKRKHWLKFHVNKNEDIKAHKKKNRNKINCKTSDKRMKLDEEQKKNTYHFVLIGYAPNVIKESKEKEKEK